MKTRIVALNFCLLLLFSIQSLSQNPDIVWTKSYGGSLEDFVKDINQTTDGGYILAGGTESSDGDVTINHGFWDAWILKLDPQGNMDWQKSYGGSVFEGVNAIIQTKDEGYLFVANTESNDGDVSGNHGSSDAWVVKLDADGNIQWQKCFGGTKIETASDVLPDVDGGYIFVGYTQSTDGDLANNFHHGSQDVWFVKIDSIGNIVSSHVFGGSGSDQGISFAMTFDGGYILSSVSSGGDDGDVANSNYHGSGDYWILKLDSLNNIQWSKCYGGSYYELPTSICQLTNGNYIIAGYSESIDGDVTGHHGTDTNYDYWIVEVDTAGGIQWQNSLGGSEDDRCYSVVELSDQTIMVAGSSLSDDGDVSNNPGQSAWIVKLNLAGSILWSSTYGGSSGEEAYDLLQNSSGGVVFAGNSFSSDGDVSSNNGELDYWVVELSASTLVNDIKLNTSFDVYPNPASDEIHFISYENLPGFFELRDIFGRIFHTSYFSNNQPLSINTSHYPRGIYFLQIHTKELTHTERVIIQ